MNSTYRRTIRLLLMTALVVAVFVPAAAFAAASAFSGGPDQWPVYVLNDHTPVAVHFTAAADSGLAPSSSYYLKVRYTVGTAPSGLTNRGYTWNPVSQRWVQEREDWTLFPTVSTDASGAISSNAGWTFVKFGDDTKSGEYHIMISLSATGDASTFNGSFVPTITVLDPRTDGSWVHNGIATGKLDSKRAAVTDVAATTVLSLQKTEMQLVDDDTNGVVDDENYGPAGSTGDFRMGVPIATLLGINLNQSVWAPGTGFLSGPADVDLSIGASDTAAPSSPGPASAVSGDSIATVSWTAATDANGIAGYYVYRWSPAPVGAAYSPVRSRVAAVAGSATSFADSGLTNGMTYLYEMRAFDASGNVGPRSTTATAAPLAATTVYRFYNKTNGSHFYTASEAEKNSVVANLSATYKLEGVAYKINTANPANSAPLYRFYNKKNGSHFYTASLAEKNSVQANLSATYSYDGPAYNVCVAPPAGSTTVWRFFNKLNSSHFYTADQAEKNNVQNNLTATYALDGPAFYLAP